MHRVMPRLSCGRVATTISASGWFPSACTLASRWSIFCSTRVPRSGLSSCRRRAEAVIPTARLSASVRSAMEAATLTAVSTEEDSPSPVCADRSRSSNSHTSAACSRSNSLTCSSPCRALESQWTRLIASPWTYGRMVLARGVAASNRRLDGELPSTGEGGKRQCGRSKTLGKTTTPVGWPTTISELKRPNGSPVRTRRAPRR